MAAYCRTHIFDHSKEVNNLFKSGVDVYMSEGTAEELELHSHRLKVVEPKKQFTIKDWIVLPFDVEHDAPEPLGFLIQKGNEKIVYITDTPYSKYTFEGLTRIMLEVNYQKKYLEESVKLGTMSRENMRRITRSHMSLQTALDFLKACDLSKTKQIYALHLSGRNSNAKEIREAIQSETGKPVYIAGR